MNLSHSHTQLLLLQNKVPGLKSIISKASTSKADLLIEAGDKIKFGDLFLEVGLQLPEIFNYFMQMTMGII
jgi:hypothetical protein